MNIVVDGYNICYKTTGTGDKTVVILQGWGTDLGVYDSVAGVIDGSRYRVIQFDFPGFREPRMVLTTPIGVLKLSGVTSTLYFSCKSVCK